MRAEFISGGKKPKSIVSQLLLGCYPANRAAVAGFDVWMRCRLRGVGENAVWSDVAT